MKWQRRLDIVIVNKRCTWNGVEVYMYSRCIWKKLQRKNINGKRRWELTQIINGVEDTAHASITCTKGHCKNDVNSSERLVWGKTSKFNSEWEGFEPSVQFYLYTRLAIELFQPLRHHSAKFVLYLQLVSHSISFTLWIKKKQVVNETAQKEAAREWNGVGHTTDACALC